MLKGLWSHIVIILLRWMHVAATSLLRDSYHYSSKLFSVMQFYSFNLFYLFNRSYCSLDICCCSLYLLFYFTQSIIHFVLLINLDQWYQSSLPSFFFVHVPDKIWVQEVGTQTSQAFSILVMLIPTTTHGG
jgi:hypothetical protein